MTVEVQRSGTPQGGLGPTLPSCLEAAIAAPSVYNTQPWRFRIAAGHVDVLADRRRRLPVIDLSGRELAISVGAAIFNLRVAMLAHHRRPAVHLLPDGAEPDLYARVTVAGEVRPSITVVSLARAIPLRHTNRRPFFPTAIPPEVLADLQAAAATEGARLVTATPAARDTVLGTVRVAEAMRRRQPAYRREIGEWTTGDRSRLDGVPPATFGPWSAVESLPLRDFGLVHPGQRRTEAEFEAEPTIALLFTHGDTTEHWLRAGQALERVLLTATVRGLSTTLMTQPLEIPHLRSRLYEPAGGLSPQVIVRLGYGPPSAPSPRRPWESFVD